MHEVVVQPPGAADAQSLINIPAGRGLTFGRGAPGVDVGMLLSHPGASRVAGEITSADGHWRLTNLSTTAAYVVENPEGAGEHVRVAPLRAAAPIPFEISRVVIPVGHETVAFHVYAPSVWFLDAAPAALYEGDRTLRAFPLDESAKYFAVLVALCEPRLRGSSPGIPSAEQVATRLRPLPGYSGLTARAVDFHIDYLAHTKFRLRAPGGAAPRRTQSPGGAITQRREALVGFALRFGLVQEEHLRLLPPRGRQVGGAA